MGQAAKPPLFFKGGTGKMTNAKVEEREGQIVSRFNELGSGANGTG